MLCQFSFQNFKSYRDETVFDLQATAIPEFKDNLIVKDKCSDLLPVSVIYGPNGGGKTNLIRALSCLITTVVRPIHDLGSTRKRVIMQQKVVAEPFLFDSESKDEPTEFEIFFRTEKYEYRYYLAVLKDEISAETLDRKTIGGKKPAHIFYRDGEELTLGTILSKENVNTKVNEKMPFLSFLAINYNIPVITEVQEWFESCIIRNYANPVAELQIMVSDNEQTKNQIIMLLNEMGIDVEDYRYDEKEEQLYTVRTISGKKYELPFNHESDGTRRLMSLAPGIERVLQKGGILMVDEIDRELHPLLVEFIISKFQSPETNPGHAQIIFTTHDTELLNMEILRKDQVYFVDKNKRNGVSELFNLTELPVRTNDNIRKAYLVGKYGAVPDVDTMEVE